MKAPDYRTAACCGNCYFYAFGIMRCSRHGIKADMLHVCADFANKEDIEGEVQP